MRVVLGKASVLFALGLEAENQAYEIYLRKFHLQYLSMGMNSSLVKVPESVDAPGLTETQESLGLGFSFVLIILTS